MGIHNAKEFPVDFRSLKACEDELPDLFFQIRSRIDAPQGVGFECFHVVVQQRLVDFLFGTEVEIEGTFGEPCFGGDVVHDSVGESFAREDLAGGVEDSPAAEFSDDLLLGFHWQPFAPSAGRRGRLVCGDRRHANPG